MQVRVIPEPDLAAKEAILRALAAREASLVACGRSAWWRVGVREGVQESVRPGGYVRESS